jgi:hypothetical protein
LIDQLLAGARSEEEIVGQGGVLAELTNRLVERALSAELTAHRRTRERGTITATRAIVVRFPSSA